MGGRFGAGGRALSALLGVVLWAGACGLTPGGHPRSDPAGEWSAAIHGLRLRAHPADPPTDHPSSFSLEVVFENVGDFPLGILPVLIHRRYRALGGGTATYVPYPGPRISPWRGALALGPGETRAVTFAGMRDGDGHWALEPGEYELSVRYVVRENLAGPSVPSEARRDLGGAQIWIGELESRPMTVTFGPRAD